jgi:uncharacterized membrane-anchored protein YhcB (DUF1043 family)
MTMTRNKKILLIIVAVVIAAGIALVVVLILKTTQKETEKQSLTSQQVDAAKTANDQAYEALKKGDYEKAAELYKKAQASFKDANELTSANNMNAQINLVEHLKNQKKPPVEAPKPLAGSGNE